MKRNGTETAVIKWRRSLNESRHWIAGIKVQLMRLRWSEYFEKYIRKSAQSRSDKVEYIYNKTLLTQKIIRCVMKKAIAKSLHQGNVEGEAITINIAFDHTYR